MKKVISVLFVLAMLVSPVFADTNASVNSSTNVEIKPGNVKWKEFKDNVNDLVYRVRYSLAFGDETRAELIQERNVHLNERQEAWVDLKQAAFSANLTAEERAQLQVMLKKEHDLIIAERLALNSELHKFHLKARVKHDGKLEERIERIEERIKESDEKHKEKLEIKLRRLVHNNTTGNVSLMTEADARTRVSALGFMIVESNFTTKEDLQVWIVKGERTITIGNDTIKNIQFFVIDAKTGLILDIDSFNYVNGSLFQDSEGETSSETEVEVNSKDSRIKTKVSLGVGI